MLTDAEKSNERQVAYSKILDAIRDMPGRRTPSKILAEINEIANRDDAWKELHGIERDRQSHGGEVMLGAPHDYDCTCPRCESRRRANYVPKKGDHIRVTATKPDGEPHPHAGKTGVITEAWITVNRLTVRVDPGIEPQGFIVISRECAEPTTTQPPEGRDPKEPSSGDAL